MLETLNKTEINKNFVINFREKKEDGTLGRYNAISIPRLTDKIGLDNTITAIEKAMNSMEQQYSKKFRKHGQVIFYRR